jgi:hypothetical protein
MLKVARSAYLILFSKVGSNVAEMTGCMISSWCFLRGRRRAMISLDRELLE